MLSGLRFVWGDGSIGAEEPSFYRFISDRSSWCQRTFTAEHSPPLNDTPGSPIAKGSRGDRLLLHYASIDRAKCGLETASPSLAPDFRDTSCPPNPLFPTHWLIA